MTSGTFVLEPLRLSSVKHEDEPAQPAVLVSLLCDTSGEADGVCFPALNP